MCLLLDQHLPNWRDRSVPKAGRYENLDDKSLNDEIERLVKDSDVFVVFTYPIVYHSNWLGTELDMAKNAGVPIVAVRPPDNERPATKVTEAAAENCGWDGAEIAAAIDRAVKAKSNA